MRPNDVIYTFAYADTKMMYNTLALFQGPNFFVTKRYPRTQAPPQGWIYNYEANKKVGGDVGIMLFTDTLCSGGTQSHTSSLHVYSTLTREGLCRNSSAGKS